MLSPAHDRLQAEAEPGKCKHPQAAGYRTPVVQEDRGDAGVEWIEEIVKYVLLTVFLLVVIGLIAMIGDGFRIVRAKSIGDLHSAAAVVTNRG